MATTAYADTVRVRAVSGVLERAETRAGPWTVLCVGPCDATVPRVGWYRLAGVRSSTATTLPADAIEVTFGAPADDHYAGLLVGACGLVVMAAAGVIGGWGLTDPWVGTSAAIVSGVLGGAGLIAAVVGFVVHYATASF